MAALRTLAGRTGTKRAVATAAVVTSLAALLLATEVPSALLPAGGGSAALAELLARSPGARVGGVALKAKAPRMALAPVASDASPVGGGEGLPATPVASVLGVGTPEGAVPGYGAGGFPDDFIAPAVPGGLAGSPGIVGGGSPDLGGVSGPGVGFPIFGGGSGGSGGGGGGGIIVTPNPNPTGTTPGPDTPIAPPTGTGPGVIPPVPEPSTWALLILGFGMTGAAMRRGRRVAFA